MNAARIAPNELATPIIIGLRLKAKPAGMATHNSTTPNKKTPNMDKKYSIGLILLPPLIYLNLINNNYIGSYLQN